MATVDKNSQMNVKTSNGDIVRIYPNTKIANVEGLQTALNGKVDAVSGKGLSTNDYTTTEKNKLAGIAAGATANIGTVTQVKVGSTAYNPSSGVVSLPAYPTTLPASDVSSWAKASSKPSYTASEVGAIATTAKGAASGVAELDANGKVPSSQLPAYVDDVLEYTAKSSFPTTGETGKIYVDTTTNLTYRWSGSAYVEISPSLALGTTSSTAYRGDRGNTAYSHATDSSRLTTAQSSGLYKIATTAQGHIASVTAVAKSDITGLGIPGSDTNTHRPIQINGTQVLGDNTTALNLKAGSNVSLSNSSGTVTIAATDTTYSAATQSANGLMSSTDKTKLDGIATGATANIGTVTQVKVGSTAYNPSSGVISLPAYPSDTNTHRPIQMNGTEILGNNTTAVNLKAGSNVSLSNSSGTVTIAATNTTYSAATQSANGLMSATDKTKLDGIATGAQVNSITGVKGNSESSYRTGNVNLTAANVGAAASSHTHGNIQNGGTLQTNDITIASGDKLVVTDSSDSSKIARTSISFDGSTTTQALTKAGSWQTFNNYSHPTSAGNKHIPSGGSSGQILGYGGSSGTAAWRNLPTVDSEFSTSSTNAVQNKVVTSELAALIDDGAKNYAYIPDYTNQSGAGYYSDIYFNIPAGDWVLSYTLTTSANFAVAVTIDGSEELYYDNDAPYSNTRIAHTLKTASSGITRFRVYFNATGTISNIMICKLADWKISQKYVPYRTTLNTLTYRMRSYTISSGAPVKMPLVRSETFTMLLFGFVQTIGCVFWALENMSGNTITVRDVYTGQIVSQTALNFSLNVGDHMLTITTNISSNSNFMILASTA